MFADMKTNRDDVIAAYRIFLDREPENDSLLDCWVAKAETTSELRHHFLGSEEYIRKNPMAGLVDAALQSKKLFEELAPCIGESYRSILHFARQIIIKKFLPPAEIVLDLGGANSPLHRMGYPHNFKKLTIIDLPVKERDEKYQVKLLEENGNVVIRYHDMTDLDGIENESVDLVWAGQSIEHVDQNLGQKMCRAAYRVLKKGGNFCLDTPNRLVTKLHTALTGGGFTSNDHLLEYTPEELRKTLKGSGFEIINELGICEMPLTVATQSFHFGDFLIGGLITRNIGDAYYQYFHCKKPIH